jgi:hypothetical protein
LFRGAIRPLILGNYFSTLDDPLLSNMLLCLTASSYKMTLLHLSQKDSIAYAGHPCS